MRCPANCDTPLVMAERHGVEIDYCPSCRGVWLDRGELDKIIDRAAALEGSAPALAPQPVAPVPPVQSGPAVAYGSPPPIHSGRAMAHGSPPPYGWSDGRRRRKGGFLGELFDC